MKLFLSIFIFSQVCLASFLTEKIKIKFKGDDLTFHVHYPESKIEFARETIRIIKSDFNQVNDYFDYLPQSNVHVVVNKVSGEANGAAGVFPRNTIFLNDFPPHKFSSLSHTNNWLRILLIHEYVHILTLEMTHGIRDFFRIFLGSSMKWSQFMPRWLSEGVATWAESKFTGEGRVKHPVIASQMVSLLKSSKTCHSKLCFDKPRHYPFGSYAYWVGAYFLEYLENQKTGTVKCLMERYSRVLPFFIESRLKKCAGGSFENLYSEFRSSYIKKNQAKCFFKNKNICKKLKSSVRNINLHKGYVENDINTYFIFNSNKSNEPYGGKDAEKLLIFNNKTNKIRAKYFDRVIDKIYSVGSKTIISLYEASNDQSKGTGRKFVLLQGSSSLNFNPEHECHELIELTKSNVVCKNYVNSRYELQEFKNNTPKTVHTFDYLERVQIQGMDHKKVDFEEISLSESELQSSERKVQKKNSAKPETARKYSGVKYLFPKYLFPNIFITQNLSFVGINTGFNDPLNRHVGSLGMSYVLGIPSSQSIDTPLATFADYTFNFFDQKWFLNASYTKSFFQSNLNDVVNTFESFSASLGHRWNIKGLSIVNSVYANKSNSQDTFLSQLTGSTYDYKRKIKSLGTNLSISHQTKSLNSIYRNITLLGNFARKKNFDFKEFNQINITGRFTLAWNKSLSQFFRGKYSVLNNFFKGTPVFRDGIIYGGGINSLLTGTGFDHPSYLIGIGSIFGSEMTSARTELELEVFKVFDGFEFLPTYFKEINLFAGGDFIKSRNLLVAGPGGAILVEPKPELFSWFAGVRLDLDFFYLLPLEIDLFAAYSGHDFYSSNTGFLIKSNLTF